MSSVCGVKLRRLGNEMYGLFLGFISIHMTRRACSGRDILVFSSTSCNSHHPPYTLDISTLRPERSVTYTMEAWWCYSQSCYPCNWHIAGERTSPVQSVGAYMQSTAYLSVKDRTKRLTVTCSRIFHTAESMRQPGSSSALSLYTNGSRGEVWFIRLYTHLIWIMDLDFYALKIILRRGYCHSPLLGLDFGFNCSC